MSEINTYVLIGVKLATDQLGTEELATLVNVSGFDGYDFRQLVFYDKIKALLETNGTMHHDMKESIILLAGRRL